ncbi:hypothetical protein FDV58_27775 [Bradyrhizobium elkanii]|uniref:Uncharacterized protein n=1 Tax=Bradyrhizobium elkanii TaxID=29448 RepID=A0A4U6RV43_BRAEL|nr:hypothetical protein [Bradyrhizobium elkanii]TKV78003.1 hypothetical protein FDV58_27775 [Bradyrhizobium elkanii]
MRSYSIRELLRAVRRLPATTPQADRLFKSGYDTHQDHWTAWLEQYDGPGYYGRSNWDRDARYVYQHLNCGPMMVWLNEAAGEDPALIERTIREMRRGGSRAQTEAKIVRQFLPWERAAWLLFRYRSYTIPELLRAVRRLPTTMPESDRLPKDSYASHKDQWIGWLEEYDGPGYYRRSNWNVDARTVYQRLNNGNMIVWLNEAAGESPAQIRLAIAKMQQGGPRKQTIAKISRSFLPWERTAWLLFNR